VSPGLRPPGSFDVTDFDGMAWGGPDGTGSNYTCVAYLYDSGSFSSPTLYTSFANMTWPYRDCNCTFGPVGAMLISSSPPSIVSACGNAVNFSMEWSQFVAMTNYIYASTSVDGTFTEIASTTNTVYTETGLTADTTYYYYITAIGPYGAVFNTAELSATTSGATAIFNVQFGDPGYSSQKTGTEAVGNSDSDCWTLAGWLTDDNLQTNCMDTCCNQSSVIIAVNGADGDPPSGYDGSSSDNLFKSFITLTWDGEIDITVPPGTYDAYLYSSAPYDSETMYALNMSIATFTLASGVSNVSDYSAQTPSGGATYVTFSDLVVPDGGTLVFDGSGEDYPTRS